MSEKAQQFLNRWIDNHIHFTGYQPEGDNSEARLQARECLEDANLRGISQSEIEEAVGDLVDYMASAIEDVIDNERNRQIGGDD